MIRIRYRRITTILGIRELINNDVFHFLIYHWVIICTYQRSAQKTWVGCTRVLARSTRIIIRKKQTISIWVQFAMTNGHEIDMQIKKKWELVFCSVISRSMDNFLHIDVMTTYWWMFVKKLFLIANVFQNLKVWNKILKEGLFT